MATKETGSGRLSRRDTNMSHMLSTGRPTFTALSPQDKARTKTPAKSGEPDGDIPPLEKIPTNEFIERFLDDDTSHLGHSPSPSQTSKRPSFSDLMHSDIKQPSSSTNLSGRGSSFMGAPANGHVTGSDEDLDDLETVLDIKERRPPYDVTGQVAYEKACRKFGALPASSVRRKLRHASSMEMPYYGTGSRGAKAIAIPMVVNTNVTSLNLKANGLDIHGVRYIAKMISENSYITELNLSENRLRSEGAGVMAQMLNTNQTLQRLELAGNNFQDSDAVLLSKPIEKHSKLRYLNLSNNEFGSKAGTVFKTVISENTILQELDLSWNHIRVRGACDLAQGVKENVGLKTLNLSWNGFGIDGAAAMAAALSTCTLTDLDLGSNRIGDVGFLNLIKALRHNDDLKILKLGKNPITEQGALAALDVLLQLEDLPLHRLDLADVILGPRFASRLADVRAQHPSLDVVFGYTDSYGRRRLRQYNVVEEALTAMRTYCLHNNINLVELFARFDEDGSMSVTHEEFKQGLKDAGIPLTPLQVEELIKALDEDGDGEIDFGELVMGAEKYDTQSEQKSPTSHKSDSPQNLQPQEEEPPPDCLQNEADIAEQTDTHRPPPGVDHQHSTMA